MKKFLAILLFASCTTSKPYYVKYQDLKKERFEMFRQYIITDCPDTVKIQLYGK